MNRIEYMRELENRLEVLAFEDRQEALSFYQEYFDEAGICNEDEVIEELGDPAKIAANIIASQVAIKPLKVYERDPVHSKNKVSTIWYMILGIFALPIALPILITVAAFIFTGIMIILSVVVLVVCVIVALVLTAIALFIGGISILLVDFTTGVFLCGTSFILASILLSLAGPLKKGVMIIVNVVMNIISKIFSKLKGRV